MAAFAEILKTFFYAPDEDIGELFKLPAQAGQMTVFQPEESAAEYLAFVLEQECYAVPIAEIREIVRAVPLTEIPRSPKNLLGVIKIRGEILPVYDVKVKLKLRERAPIVAGLEGEAEELPGSARILIVRDPEGDIGILVDRVLEVIHLRPSEIEPLVPGIGGGDYLLGLGHLGKDLFIVLDVHKALA